MSDHRKISWEKLWQIILREWLTCVDFAPFFTNNFSLTSFQGVFKHYTDQNYFRGRTRRWAAGKSLLRELVLYHEVIFRYECINACE